MNRIEAHLKPTGNKLTSQRNTSISKVSTISNINIGYYTVCCKNMFAIPVTRECGPTPPFVINKNTKINW